MVLGTPLFKRSRLKYGVGFQVDGEKKSGDAEIKKETDSSEPKKPEDESKTETPKDRVIKDGQLQVTIQH